MCSWARPHSCWLTCSRAAGRMLPWLVCMLASVLMLWWACSAGGQERLRRSSAAPRVPCLLWREQCYHGHASVHLTHACKVNDLYITQTTHSDSLLILPHPPQVRVHTGAGVFEADAAIVTVPLGVLKRPDVLQFQPPLPPRKQAAIQRLGFGCLNKIMLLFPYCFWGDRVGVWELSQGLTWVSAPLLPQPAHTAWLCLLQQHSAAEPQSQLGRHIHHTAPCPPQPKCPTSLPLLRCVTFCAPQDMFGHVSTDPDTSQRGRFFLFYTYDGISGGAVLGALVAGDAAIRFEETSKEQSVADVMALLRSIFGPDKVEVPDPLEVRACSWWSGGFDATRSRCALCRSRTPDTCHCLCAHPAPAQLRLRHIAENACCHARSLHSS